MKSHIRGTIHLRWLAVCLAAGCWIGLARPAGAATYTVSPGGSISSLKSIVNSLQPGDIVNIEPGVYHEAMKITANGTASAPIIIRGVGSSMPVFDATGVSVSGSGPTPRAIFQIQGANIVVENLEFRNARNGNNGAGIRLLNSTNAVIRACKIAYCDMGMMGGDTATALIEGCDVGFNGTADYDGYSHNFYMGGAGAIVLRGNYIHDAIYGQNFKSRAHYNELWYNWIADSNEGEVGPVDSPATTTPNSNFLMVGNVVVAKPDRTGNHVKYINFGQDMTYTHNGTMFMYNNTLIATDGRQAFIWISDSTGVSTDAVVANNLFYGSDKIVTSSTPAGAVAGSNNWVPAGAVVLPGLFTASVTGADPDFLDPAGLDFRLMDISACVDAGTDDLYYYDGDGVRHTVVLDQSYLLGVGLIPRGAFGPIDIGAYETVPEPTTLAMLALGGLGALGRAAARRRRRHSR